MAVKIIEFEAENVKRVKAVQIIPSVSGLTVIGGDNNQGKTSVLDALAWALGGDKYRPATAQREGSCTPPALKVNLSNGLVVERKGKNSTLTVTDPSGRKGGQQLLAEFVEQLALDLPRFMAASDKDKADTLLKIIGVGDKLALLDRDIKAKYDHRTAVGQIAEQKKNYADEMISYPDAPAEPISVSELIRQQQDILARNGQRQQWAAEQDKNSDDIMRTEDLISQAEQRVRDLRAVLAELHEKNSTVQKSPAEMELESTAELETSIGDIEEINRRVRANLDKERAEDDANELDEKYKALTDEIAAMRADRMKLLDGANLPLPGLSVDDGALTYEGKHWGDMSGSDQLRVATAIVRKLNPECGFVLLDKLEQMDRRTLAEFGSWLEHEGLQAIATRVSTGDECSIIIEDGRVLGQDEPQPEPKQWTKGVF